MCADNDDGDVADDEGGTGEDAEFSSSASKSFTSDSAFSGSFSSPPSDVETVTTESSASCLRNSMTVRNAYLSDKQATQCRNS